MGRQDLGQLRLRFLGAVFLVAADEDNVLAFSRSLPPVQDNPRIVRPDWAREVSRDAYGDNSQDSREHLSPHQKFGDGDYTNSIC
jgi:hypothetical protein